LVVVIRPLAALGMTIRWVERVDCPGRAGFNPPVRGIGIGWVVAVPAGGEDGISPVG
jgi:hypothetical protein